MFPKYYKVRFPISKTNAKIYHLQWAGAFKIREQQYLKFFECVDKGLGTCL